MLSTRPRDDAALQNMMRSSLFCLLVLVSQGQALSLNSLSSKAKSNEAAMLEKTTHLVEEPSTRRSVLQSALATTFASLTATSLMVGNPTPAHAQDDETTTKVISDEEIRQIVTADLLDRQFLVTGNLTPSIYRPTATFTDEIDTYQMDQWQKGTAKLFVGEKSQVRLVGDVQVSREKVELQFDEDLMFRIPFRPTVSLTGRLVLERDDSGLITSYREFWDQDVVTVLKSAKF